ncbi:MAG: hypothetical protein DFNUSKGM_001636 [Candidatus Fervidibacter sacchari]
MFALLGLSISLLTGIAGAQQIVARSPQAPVLDGVPDEPAWSKATVFNLTHRLGNGKTQVGTIVKMTFNGDRLFVLFVCEEPDPKAMKRAVRQRDGEVWRDDCVEVFLAPDPNEPSSYYHIVVNSLGIVRDEFWCDGKDDVGWDSNAKVAARVESNRWVAEIAIPLERLNRVPIFSEIWKVNFARQRYSVEPPELSTWQPCKASFHEPENFGTVTFEDINALPSVRKLSGKIVQSEANRLLKTIRQLLTQLPTVQKTETGKEVAKLLTDWQHRLSERNLSGVWRQVRTLDKQMPTLSAIVARAKLAERSRRPYAVFAVSPMLKLRPEQIPESEPLDGKSVVSLFAAKGEAESLQIIVAALEKDLEGVKVGVTPLVGPKGSVILPEVRLVGYVPVQKPTPGGFGVAGSYPDPLLPIRTFDVQRGRCQSVWLTVWVPRNSLAGVYEGAIVVEPKNAAKLTVPIRLRVYDVTLPVQSHLKTCVLIWDYKARQVYGDAWTPERSRRFYELCLRYRFTPPPPLPWDKVFVKQPDGTWVAKWDEFDREVEAWMSKGATAFSIGGILRWGTKPPPENEREDVAAKLKLLGEHLKRKGWSERFYFYVFDEPSTAEFANIEALCRFVHQHAPNLNILLTAGYGATGPFRSHAPTPEGAAYRALAGSINIWVPHIDCFDEPFLRERKKLGDQVWMYVCISTVGKTYPDIWRIDWTGVSHRAIGWWLWRYGCEGFLYWCVNYWTDDKGKPFDLFANPVAYPGGNGDGFLFYPDPQRGDPIPSVRVEIFRDAIEDYDLLTMLHRTVTSLKADKKFAQKLAKPLSEVEQLLDASNLILAANKFVDDPRPYEQRHKRILELLELLAKGKR